MNNLAPMKNWYGAQGNLNWMRGYMPCLAELRTFFIILQKQKSPIPALVQILS